MDAALRRWGRTTADDAVGAPAPVGEARAPGVVGPDGVSTPGDGSPAPS